MDLKNCKIGVLLEDYLLRRRITDLLRQNGAIVHCARDEDEMEEPVGTDGFGCCSGG